MAQVRFGFIGAGRMAIALAQGFIATKLADPQQIVASDPSAAQAAEFRRATGAEILPDNPSVARAAETIVLAVKPQHMPAVLAELQGDAVTGKLIVSIAAGITLSRLQAGLGERARVVRVMPNTPCLVCQGASAYSLGPHATRHDAEVVEKMLSAVGQAHEVSESLLDAVTGLSGSGPAFVFSIIEALSDGGVKMGLPRALATALAAKTVHGAAALLLATGEHPGVLKDQVASPGGTTIAGLHALERGGLRAALMDAVEAATRRSIELGQPTGKN